MKIVCLDGYTTNPGDISWSPVEKHGELTVYDKTSIADIQNRVGDAEIVMTNKTPLDRETLKQFKNVKFIALLSTGYDVVDITAAKELGITVSNVPSYSTNEVAQLTFALILELMNKVGEHNKCVKAGDWTKSEHFSFTCGQIESLHGKTIGIFGYGKIGKAVAKIAEAFGMEIIAYNRSEINCKTAKQVDITTLFKKSDILTLHAPYNNETHEIINKANIEQMKSSAIIINTARGKLINEADLAYALDNGRIAGAGLDVLSTEPPKVDNPLLTAKNTIITPHIAWAAKSARLRLIEIVGENIGAFIKGKPQNSVK